MNIERLFEQVEALNNDLVQLAELGHWQEFAEEKIQRDKILIEALERAQLAPTPRLQAKVKQVKHFEAHLIDICQQKQQVMQQELTKLQQQKSIIDKFRI